MRKIVFILALFLLVSVVSAFSLEDILLFDLDSSIIGRSVNNRDPSVSLNRPVDTQVVNNPVVFKWRYFDPEDDELEMFILQIDDDPKMYSPMNYQGVGEEFTISLDEGGEYFWRVQVTNKYGKKLSEVWSFYLDPKMKVCEDGTAYFECSLNRPWHCDAGVLREKCQRCGCPKGGTCQLDGSCEILECSDGTLYSQCSWNQPFFCVNGKLKDVCSLCGCSEGEECTNDGNCAVIVQDDVLVEISDTGPLDRKLSILERIALFFKNLLIRR